ncbi:hypothetical protein [Kutzneria buriramensis]|uniref:hypothetical protein n=1 Tax=Kutzneria buriramensis TaxID=1045776 RepID=UPI000E22A5D3|nr:hypothetical protein [Kutzneria buriramensis]
MRTGLNALLTALHVTNDDHLGKPTLTGRPPRLTVATLDDAVRAHMTKRRKIRVREMPSSRWQVHDPCLVQGLAAAR